MINNTKPVHADGSLSLAVKCLVVGALAEINHYPQECVNGAISEAMYWACRYKDTWVFDFIYDPAWQAKDRAARQQRQDAHAAGY